MSRANSRVTRPSKSTMIRSAIPSTSGSSDEIIRMATPWPARSDISAWISDLAPTSMPWVGSSSTSTDGLVISQRLSATFCWLPPESVATGTYTAGALMPSRRV